MQFVTSKQRCHGSTESSSTCVPHLSSPSQQCLYNVVILCISFPPAFCEEHRPLVVMLCLKDKVNHGQDHRQCKDDGSVVERASSDWHSVGPKHEEENDPGVSDGDTIDENTPASKAPSRLRQQVWLCDSSVEDARDGYRVCSHLSSGANGDDGVVRIGRANIDGTKANSDNCREEDRVDR